MSHYRLLLLLLLAFTTKSIVGQNLIANPSFEQYSSCPDGIDQIDRSRSWYTVASTPDYLNECSQVPELSVPVNRFGNQSAHTGNAYAHIGVYAPNYEGSFPGHKEFMGTRLVSPLVVGRQYEVSFYVSLTEVGSYAIDALGIHLSKDSLLPLPNGKDSIVIAQVSNTKGRILKDTKGWTKVSGLYTAIGGEQYLTIGNFLAVNSVVVDTLKINAPNQSCSYYIDDVAVVDVCDTYIVKIGPYQSLCPLQTEVLDAGAGFLNYHWNTGSNKQKIIVSEPGIYWVDVQTPCSVLRDSITITSGVVPKVQLGKDTTLCEGQSLRLDVTTMEANYIWQDGSVNTFYEVNQPGTYWVSVFNACGSAVDTLRVKYDCPLQIPNVITPNGDGLNDRFIIDQLGDFSWHLEIYNRWGKVVYSSDAYQNTWEAFGLANGTYYYVIFNPLKATYKGWLEVLR